MLNNETKKEMNRLVHNIKYYRMRIESCMAGRQHYAADEFKRNMDRFKEGLDSCIREMDSETAMVHARNYDKSVQRSVNYYRRKAGLRSYRITAIY